MMKDLFTALLSCLFSLSAFAQDEGPGLMNSDSCHNAIVK